MDNYFKILGIDECILLDEKALRRHFFKLSLANHPDKNLGDIDANNKFARVTKAYEVLKNKDLRIGHILTLYKIIGTEKKEQPSMDFLMEMMDINEGLMALEFDFNKESYDKIKIEIDKINVALNDELSGIESISISAFLASDFEKLKNYYYKKRYLLRILEKLDKFASL